MRKNLLVVLVLVITSTFSSVFAKTEGFRASKSQNKQTDYYSHVAFKTNVLYDIVAVPNLGVEINLYDNWTIYGEAMYAGWRLPAHHFYWDIFGTQFGVKKYFGPLANRRSFSGHHAGIYGQALAYDLQAGNIGQQTPEINIGAGIDYGYSFPIALGFNLDVEIGVGYLAGKYYEYIVDEEHYTWRGTVKRSWFGPTKASVSLVWLIKSRKKPKSLR